MFKNEIIPTYTEIKVNGKNRRVRFFGQVTFIDLTNKVKVIKDSTYLFIKNEPVTIYSDNIDAVRKEKKYVGLQTETPS